LKGDLPNSAAIGLVDNMYFPLSLAKQPKNGPKSTRQASLDQRVRGGTRGRFDPVADPDDERRL
jgi:hypothetical protein